MLSLDEVKRLKTNNPTEYQAWVLDMSVSNPVAAMPLDVFITYLASCLDCSVQFYGKGNTSTIIHMSRGLAFLRGDCSDPCLPAPFDWLASIKLMGPMAACIYQRMYSEVAMLQYCPDSNFFEN